MFATLLNPGWDCALRNSNELNMHIFGYVGECTNPTQVVALPGNLFLLVNIITKLSEDLSLTHATG